MKSGAHEQGLTGLITFGYGAMRCARKASFGVLTTLAVVSGAVMTAAHAAPVTIVALGDSLTHGYGLPASDGFVPQLQTWLRANGAPEVTVINAGVSGDTTAGGAARLEWSLAEGGEALTVELGGNDLLRAIDPAATRDNLAAIMAGAADRDIHVLLTGMRAPLNYGPEYKAEFDAIYPDLAQEYGAIHDPFFLEGLVGENDLFQPDGIHPNAEGVTVLVNRFGPLVLSLIDRVQPGGE